MTAGSGFGPVVDDHLVNRLAAVPRPRARRVSCAGGGEWAAGTQGASRRVFDCVPLDVLMPELDGYQVLELIRSDPSRSGTRR
jgi:CheY-like chemotaxis protein